MRVPVLHEDARSAYGAGYVPKTRRLKRYDVRWRKGTIIRTANDAVRIVHKKLMAESQEVFVEFVTNVRGLLLEIYEIARGQKSHVTIGADDVIYAALGGGTSSKRGEAFLVFHNHPSGDPEPSPADRRLTKRIADAAAPFEPDLMFLGQGAIGARRWWWSADDAFHRVPT